MKAPPEISTARLALIQPMPKDAAGIFARYASDREVTKFLGWPRHQSTADTEMFLNFSASEWEKWPAGPYLIKSREDGRLLGGTGFGFDAPDHAVTGYVLARDSWGRGFATEALKAMVDLAPKIGLKRLSAFCHPQHRASSHVLEKCGFARDPTWSTPAEFPNLAPGVHQEVHRYEYRIESR